MSWKLYKTNTKFVLWNNWICSISVVDHRSSLPEWGFSTYYKDNKCEKVFTKDQKFDAQWSFSAMDLISHDHLLISVYLLIVMEYLLFYLDIGISAQPISAFWIHSLFCDFASTRQPRDNLWTCASCQGDSSRYIWSWIAFYNIQHSIAAAKTNLHILLRGPIAAFGGKDCRC